MQKSKIKIKNLLIIGFLVFLFSAPILAQAASPQCTNCGVAGKPDCGGFVKCGRSCDDPSTTGKDEYAPCQFCDVFSLAHNIINFIMFVIAPAVAVLMFVIAGFLFLTSGGNPQKAEQAKSVLTATVVGLVIILTAWMLLNALLASIGVASWTGIRNGLWQFNCH